ncbi:hypothetical protein [Thermobrachium celere]|uniref:hypothetical protein n=1 Tax=Thermobrachium celere TaxID=53422 RepID=UPI0019423ABE|nr:hypothetical protein [Thermobrachium celere]GFR35352.1 hypothetical protein TCEA9_11640 [Thermobrachium celere]
MALTREEKETIVLFNEAEDTMEVFTYNKALIRKLLKFSETYSEVEMKRQNEEGGFTFILPKNWFSIRPPRKIKFKDIENRKNRLP